MSNLIDKQAAIDAINTYFGFNIEEEYGSAVQEVINGLPSAQPEIIRCKDCRYYNIHECKHRRALVFSGDDDFCSYAERRIEGDVSYLEEEEAGWDMFEPGKYHYDEAAANP